MSKLVSIKFHGDLGNWMGHNKWELAVNSVAQAINSINILTDNKFIRYFIDNNKLYAKYRVLINGKDFYSPVSEIDIDNYEMIKQTNLMYKQEKLETIDIVPFIENNDSKILGIITLIVGIALIVTGIFAPFGGWLAAHSALIIFAGLALASAGAMALLARPPEFGSFRPVDKAGKNSYLFSGPVNIIGEGGPVPVGYGKLLVGSQVISSAYQIVDYRTFRDTNTKGTAVIN